MTIILTSSQNILYVVLTTGLFPLLETLVSLQLMNASKQRLRNPRTITWTESGDTKTWLSQHHLYCRHNWYGKKQKTLVSTAWFRFNSLCDKEVWSTTQSCHENNQWDTTYHHTCWKNPSSRSCDLRRFEFEVAWVWWEHASQSINGSSDWQWQSQIQFISGYLFPLEDRN